MQKDPPGDKLPDLFPPQEQRMRTSPNLTSTRSSFLAVPKIDLEQTKHNRSTASSDRDDILQGYRLRRQQDIVGKRASTRKFLSYQKERQKFRSTLVDMIFNEPRRFTNEESGSTFPSLEERISLRYYYYIHNGLNIDQVAALSAESVDNILKLVPPTIQRGITATVDKLCQEVRSNYLLCVKKAAVDFVLKDIRRDKCIGNPTSNTIIDDECLASLDGSKKILNAFQHSGAIIRTRLHTVNICLQKILDLWHKSYSDLTLVKTESFIQQTTALDLSAFMQQVNQHMEQTKHTLSESWLPSIQTILTHGSKRGCVPTKSKMLHSFLNTVAILMSLNLQSACMKSLELYCNLLCEKKQSTARAYGHAGIVLRLKFDEKEIQFEPSFSVIEAALLSVTDKMVTICRSVRRIETLVPEKDTTQRPLKPTLLKDYLESIHSRIKHLLQEEAKGPLDYISFFDKYNFIISGKIQDDVDAFISEGHTFEEDSERVLYYNAMASDIFDNTPQTVAMGMFELQCIDGIKYLAKQTQHARGKLLNKMAKDLQNQCQKLCLEYEEIGRLANETPANTEQMTKLKNFIETVERDKIATFEADLMGICNRISFLVDYMSISPAEMRQNTLTFQLHLSLPEILANCKKTLIEKRVEFEALLKERRNIFMEELERYSKEVNEFSTFGDINEIKTYYQKAKALSMKLESAQDTIQAFNVEEQTFGWQLTQYPHRKQTMDKIVPYFKLYETTVGFEEKYKAWMGSPLAEIIPDAVDEEVTQYWKNMFKIERSFTDIHLVKVLTQKVKAKIEEFKEHLPLVQTLCNPGLRLRHWEQIGDVIGFPLRPDEDTTLAKIIDLNLDEFIGRFEAISEAATKEYNLEKALQKMVQEWDTMIFAITAYRETGTYILTSLDDVQQLLDDHIVKTQTMKSSPFITPFETELNEWETKLLYLQEILDEWLKVQTTWLYLEPIFASPDIMTQMPDESRRFNTVDKHWREIMKNANLERKVLAVLSIDRMLERLRKSNELLEMIQKGLNEYLERKRLIFPRFFFLSNDELLEILSETKDPTRVQPHLRKCFEGIAEVTFAEGLEVTHMISSHGERVELYQSIVTSKARGQVEQWLGELEIIMKASVKKVIKECLEMYPEKEIDTWLKNYPGQAVLCVTQLMWTAKVHQALQLGSQSLEDLHTEISIHINELLHLVRHPLSAQDRITLCALVVLEIHARDIVNLLTANNVTNDGDFLWLSQLRYYLEDDTIMAKMISSSLEYSCEYLGNTGRLVITPLTERCFRTLFGALGYHLGGALEGPAGTGKTETIKDLAKAIAKQCVVFNCSESLDYISLGKFFKGLASCGAWSCFDEFNRIDMEVLSVVAQQILTIQRGIHSGSKNLTFAGADIRLDPTCGVFITMNPGYACRSELPDNLKTLFRPVAMAVPDYNMIAEIALYSYGFVKARPLAVKIIMMYRLCAEQLSSQSHYDNGMRAIKAVLTAAAAYKVKFPSEEQEEELVLRAIQDVNLPKFLFDDVPLFKAIVHDLFPQVTLTPPDYLCLDSALQETCTKLNLQCTEHFKEKMHQIYETTLVRHGLMIVGGPFAGKTCAYQTLASAMQLLSEKGEIGENRVQIVVINPKAITLGQLYGQFDATSHEWIDGILAANYRNFALSSSPDHKWLVFDGPVDAVWIENMNTVLDDNKKLCLISGEIIPLSSSMKLIFETNDLESASPATVSRCGMIYMEPQSLGWMPIVQSWLSTLHPAIKEEQKQDIVNMFQYFCIPLMQVIRLGFIKELVTTTDANLVSSLTALMDCFLNDLKDEKQLKMLGSGDLPLFVQCSFLFACVWSIGGSADTEGKEKFDVLLRNLIAETPFEELNKYGITEVVTLSQKLILPFPDEGMVYDYKFARDIGKYRWVNWCEDLKHVPPIPRDIMAHEITVSTKDTICFSSIISMLINNRKPVMCVGPCGSGKSVIISEVLNKKLNINDYKILSMYFTANSKASHIQEIIMSKLDKRRKGIYGPPLGKRMLVFVDDLNLCVQEPYGAQPPIELLRQLLDHESWYESHGSSRIKLKDVQLLAAIGCSGGGHEPPPARFLRHFNIIAKNQPSCDVIKSIFGNILLWHLDARGFSKDFDPSVQQLVEGTLQIHSSIVNYLLPTPAKSHYIFNLRDFSRVMQGVLLSVPETMENLRALKRLWTHEVFRVYYDRLVELPEKSWLFECIKTVCSEKLKEDFHQLFAHLDSDGDGKVTEDDIRNLIFCDFADPKADTRTYCEIQDLDHLWSVVDGYLNEYNNMSKKPMNLVMFRYAVEHLSRITRIVRQPRGHALLLGIGGSGRQSLTCLAAHITDYELRQIEVSRRYTISDWREDLKRILLKTATEEKHSIFLLKHNQIKYENFLDDISSILSSGEIPNLFSVEEKQDICDKMREIDRQREKPMCPDGDPPGLYNLFIQTIKEQLHIVLSLRPHSASFRDHMRKFPTLINYCTAVWIQPWPEDALEAVASKYLNDMNLQPEEKQKCINMCKTLHISSQHLAERFQAEMKRCVYVTPTSYLEMICLFKSLLQKKRDEVAKSKRRYEAGLEKLALASTQVRIMRSELSTLQPQLVEASNEVDSIMATVEKESMQVAQVEKIVRTDEEHANQQAGECEAIQSECDRELQSALPELESAIAALNTLTNNDITIVKTMKNPPGGVKMVMEAICILKGIKSDRIPDPSGTGKMVEDYWGPSKKMLGDMKFLESLTSFDKDSISAKAMKTIREKFITNPEFNPEKVKSASAAAEGLCKWVVALEAYDRVIKDVAPKQEALKVAAAEMEIAKQALEEKQASLKEVQERLHELTTVLDKHKSRRTTLETQVDQCTLKLERAQQLLQQLGGEKNRWQGIVDQLTARATYVIGDVLVSSGVIAYLGPFVKSFRQSQIQLWLSECSNLGIQCSVEFSFSSFLGEPVTIQSWKICGLPADIFSVENAIITSTSRRWPLMIDPQGQANKWIKNWEKPNGIQVLKLSDSDYLRTLENCIQFGKPVLLENVGEELDPILDTILLRQTFKQGGTTCIEVGESVIECSPDFRLYLTTRHSNPQYSPETAVKVTLINFVITPSGLEDQLLSIVVAQEKPELEEERTALIIQSADNNKHLKEIEDKILEVLSTSQGNILHDESAIKVLSSSKILANEIAKKEQTAVVTEAKLDASRIEYRPIATHGCILFFTIAELASLNPMYQFSLPWFVSMFLSSIDNTEKTDDTQKRLQSLEQHFTRLIYNSVCRGLFEGDKLIFSILLCANIMKHRGEIEESDWWFLLTGGGPISDLGDSTEDRPNWIAAQTWREICQLRHLKIFSDILEDVLKNDEAWKDFLDLSKDPTVLPGKWENSLDAFQKLLLIQSARSDRVIPYMQQLIAHKVGEKYIEPPHFDIERSFADSHACTPILFLLSPGVDPAAMFLKFAEDMGFGGVRLNCLSLGQGQGPMATVLVQEAIKVGTWVLLQNCHLAKSWMPALEKLCEDLAPESTHPDFRLWLTSYPFDYFPTSVLQCSIKITNESPRGLKANVLHSYLSNPMSDMNFFNSSKQSDMFKRLLFGLCSFHTIIQERKHFGSLGWNIPYEFNETDLKISALMMASFIKDKEDIPIKYITYIIGECNYGGRVTDDWDRRTLLTILDMSLSQHLIPGQSITFSDQVSVTLPVDGQYEEYLEVVRGLPMSTSPEVLGLNSNAAINRAQSQTTALFDSVLKTQVGRVQNVTTHSVASSDQMVLEIVDRISKALPEDLQITPDHNKRSQQPGKDASLNLVLVQEVYRFNLLLATIRHSLHDVKNAMTGITLVTPEVEEISESLIAGRVSAIWLSRSYPSTKPLGAYIKDLIERIKYFMDWIDNGCPSVVWISAFFSTQSYLTAMLQTYSRKANVAMELLHLECTVLEEKIYDQPPLEGAYIRGLFLEGAHWDRERHLLVESLPKQLRDPMPPLWLRPTLKENSTSKCHMTYTCPVYRTSSRQGEITSTGLSTNFVFSLQLPSELPEKHWIVRGVALLCTLEY